MEIVAKYLMLPSSLIALTSILGIALLCIRSTRRWGVFLGIFAFTLYVIFAAGPVSFFLLGHLEYQIAPSGVSEREGIRTVVVLAAHAESDLGIPLSSRISSGTAFRLLEAISLFRSSPSSTVIVSGGGATPAIMRDVLVVVGIPADHVVVDTESFSTVESAKHLASTLGTVPFLLVTSAGHMPRAMGVFLKAGMLPRPVPTHYMTKQNWMAIQYLPSPAHLGYSDLAVSEYAALLWYRIKGWL